jgi:hypothetical protein
VPLPPLDKTWLFNVNQRFLASGSSLTDSRNVLRIGFVNALLGFASNPWTVVGSCNAVASGMDGVNRWQNNSDLTWVNASGGAHSWIVLQQAALGPKVQLCIDLVTPNLGGSPQAHGNMLTMHMSLEAGFGAANGGTDGSTTARPTATDEENSVITPSVGWLNGSSASSASRDYLVNVMMSNDGHCTRCFIRRPDVAAYTSMFMFERAKTPVPNWAHPVVARWVSSTGSVPVYTVWSDNAYLRGRAPSGAMGLFLTSEAWVNNMAGQRVTTKNEIADEFELFPMGVASETVGARGRHGRIFDMYWVSTQLADGHSFPGDESRQLLVMGDMAVPWPGVVPELV